MARPCADERDEGPPKERVRQAAVLREVDLASKERDRRVDVREVRGDDGDPGSGALEIIPEAKVGDAKTTERMRDVFHSDYL